MTIMLEYLHKGRIDQPFELSRRDVPAMARLLKTLVGQARIAGIDMLYREADVREDEPNTLLIGGRDLSEILEGLDIVLESDCSTCSANCSSTGCEVAGAGRGDLDWNRRVLEDVPEIVLKNAISKVISES